MNHCYTLLYAFLATITLLCSNHYIFAQQPDTLAFKNPYTHPQFIGGSRNLLKYIRDNIRTENLGADSEMICSTAIEFIVNEDGSISDIKSFRYPEAKITKELIRITASMPKWKPATEKGKPIRMIMKLPFTYKPQY